MDDRLMKTFARTGEPFVAGRGAILVDRTGAEFVDFLSGLGVNALGHDHPELTAALRDQVGKVMHLSSLFRHPYLEPVGRRLCELAGMDRAFLTNSGTESVECALKIARKTMQLRGAPDRTAFVGLENGFHGRTFGAMSLTHKQGFRAPFQPMLDVTWVEPDDVDALAAALRARPAALVIEPIQGEGGVRALAGDYLLAARRLCDETGTILVHDEIQSGCGRTGRFLAAQHFGEAAAPDIVTLAKPVGGGLPMGACLARGDAADTLQLGDHGSTQAGGPLVCRAATVFLEALAGGLLGNVEERGAELRAGLEDLARELEIVGEVRGRGLMLGVELRHSAAAAWRRMFDAGLIVNLTAGTVLRLLPPYVITREQVRRGLRIMRAVLGELDADPAPTETKS